MSFLAGINKGITSNAKHVLDPAGIFKGSQYKAGRADQLKSTNQGQLNNAYNQTQGALGQQQAFANATGAVNGLGNQQSVFNQLQGVANGQGPNPAMAQLNNATGQNVANQAALMASQRGVSANPGMMARQAAMQGGNIQQQAAGQGAAMQAEQSMNAMNQLGGIAGQQVGQQQNALMGLNQAAQSQQQNLLNAAGTANTNAVNMQSNINNVDSGTAAATAKAKGELVGGAMKGIGAMFSDENLKENVHPADQQIQQFLDTAGAHEYEYKPEAKGLPGAGEGKHVSPMAQELEHSELGKQMVIDTPNGKMIDYAKGMGTMLAGLASLNKRLEESEKRYAQGGQVPQQQQHFVNGGMAQPPISAPAIGKPEYAGMSGVGRFLFDSAPKSQDVIPAAQQQQPASNSNEPALEAGSEAMTKGLGSMMSGKGGSGEGAASGGAGLMSSMGGGMMGMAKGSMVPGKAKVKGDSTSNDTVDAKLSPGEIIIPRSIVNSKNAPAKAAKFVAAILAKQNLKRT